MSEPKIPTTGAAQPPVISPSAAAAPAKRNPAEPNRGSDAIRPAVDPFHRNWVWSSLQLLLRLVFTVWLRYRSRGMEHLPGESGALLLSNHQSFLDPLLIGLPLTRPVSFLARDTLFPVPVIGWILRNTYVMPLNREGGAAAGIRQTVERMRQGYLVGIFPEGTRSRDGQVGELKPGFAALLRRSELPVLPIGIAGAATALGRDNLWLRPVRVCVVFGTPFDPAVLERLSKKGQEEALLAHVRARIVECQQQAQTWLDEPLAQQPAKNTD